MTPLSACGLGGVYYGVWCHLARLLFRPPTPWHLYTLILFTGLAWAIFLHWLDHATGGTVTRAMDPDSGIAPRTSQGPPP